MRAQRPDLAWEIDELNAMIEGRDSRYYRVLESAQEAAPKQQESIALAPGMTATRYVPPRSANPASDVLVPVLQSVFAAVVIFIAAIVVLANVTWFGDLRQEALTIAGVVSALSLAAIYLNLMRRHSDATTFVQVIEEITRIDINQDGAIGAPPITERVTEPMIIHTQPETRKYRIPNFGDIPYEALHVFLDYADEDGLTLDAARQAGLTRKQWEPVITYLVKLQLAEPKEQGEDAHLLVEHDELMQRVFKGN
jgi:hypothetical protein